MNPIDLLKLAEQADREGRYAIADKLTTRATRVADNWFTTGLRGLFGGGERGAIEGAERGAIEGFGRGGDEAAAEALVAGGGVGNVNLGTSNAAAAQVHGGQNIANQMTKIDQAIVQTNEQIAKTRQYNITINGETKPMSTWTTEEVERALVEGTVDPKSLKNANNKIRLSNRMKLLNQQKAKLSAEVGLKQEANATSQMAQSGAHVGGDITSVGAVGRKNMTAGGDINIGGVSNAALLGGMGIVGALGALGMYLSKDGYVRDRDNVVVAPHDIPKDIAARLPRYQMMTRREEAKQLGGQRALDAQNFVDSNARNPRVKNQRDWYNLALQTSGGDENFANNVITYVKASPEIPSNIGGGPNI
jgi:hypothetical protein